MRYVGIRNDLFLIETTVWCGFDFFVGEHYCVFHLTENTITQCATKEEEKEEGKEPLYKVSLTDDRPLQLYLATGFLGNKEECEEVKVDNMLQAAYGSAYLFFKHKNFTNCLDILGAIGDKHLIDSVSNSFTERDIKLTDSRLFFAIQKHAKGRFLKGRDSNYLPDPDAFCLLDAVDTLLADTKSYFLPMDSAFRYNPISPATEIDDGYSKFTPNPDVKCSFSDLTWNENRLNLSIKTEIPGHIELKEGYKDLGFSQKYPTFVNRNFALVRDGVSNIDSLPVKLSTATASYFRKKGLFQTLNNKNYLKLDDLPIINRTIANDKTSAASFCDKVFEKIQLKAHIKALNYIKRSLDSIELEADILNENQRDFLLKNGITAQGYTPPVEREPISSYLGMEFSVKISGLTSLPKVEAVIKKMEKNKNLTAGDELIKQGLDLFYTSPISDRGDALKLVLANEYIQGKKIRLHTLNSEVQRAKFSVVLGDRWFDEFERQDKTTFIHNDIKFIFELKEVSVPI